MHPMLRRLDDLAAYLATRGDVLALLGLGSAGTEHDRMDDHSDLDFFVVVDDGAKDRYLSDIDWLAAAHPVAYSFANERNGRKALFADGVFVEYGIFTVDELARLPFAGARIVWQRAADAPPGLAECGPPLAGPPFDTVEFHLNEALTNLYVGLHRELRGERLTAARFIQTYAVDRIIALLNLTAPAGHRRDSFEASRRVEQAYPPEVLPLATMVPGYEGNWAAAQFTLDWLSERFPVDLTIAAAIQQLLSRRQDSWPAQ
jgi:hypothetical protein